MEYKHLFSVMYIGIEHTQIDQSKAYCGTNLPRNKEYWRLHFFFKRH